MSPINLNLNRGQAQRTIDKSINAVFIYSTLLRYDC